MFRSARTIEAEVVDKKLTKLREEWQRTASTWFDGSPASVDRRIAKLDAVIAFAARAQHADGPAGGYAATSLPDMHAQRNDLLTVRDRLAGGIWENEHGVGFPHGEAWNPGLSQHFDTEGPAFPDKADLGGPEGHSRGFVLPGGDNGFSDVPPEGLSAVKERGTGRERILDQRGTDRFCSVRNAARDFIDEQNTTDRHELLMRAQRLIADRTSSWSTEASNRAVREFVGAVDAEIPTGAPMQQQRIASVRDFDDALLFG